jgi:hypothetical protein
LRPINWAIGRKYIAADDKHEAVATKIFQDRRPAKPNNEGGYENSYGYKPCRSFGRGNSLWAKRETQPLPGRIASAG